MVQDFFLAAALHPFKTSAQDVRHHLKVNENPPVASHEECGTAITVDKNDLGFVGGADQYPFNAFAITICQTLANVASLIFEGDNIHAVSIEKKLATRLTS